MLRCCGQLSAAASSLFPFKNGRCVAALPDQNWEKPVVSMYTYLLSREVVCEKVVFRVVFMEELHNCISHMETKPRDLICSAKNDNCCSKLMSQNLVYLAVAEGNLFSNSLDSGTILSISRQHWAIIKPAGFEDAFQWIELEIWHNVEKYKHIILIVLCRQGGSFGSNFILQKHSDSKHS